MSTCAPWEGGSRSEAGIQGFNATPETLKLSESISLYPDRVYFHTCIPQKFATTPVLATIIIRSLKPPVGIRDEVQSIPETREAQPGDEITILSPCLPQQTGHALTLWKISPRL